MFRRHALLLFVGGVLLYTPLFSFATTTLGISPEKVAKPVIRTLDSTGNVGAHTSIAVARDGTPVISYYEITTGNLKFAKCLDPQCSATTLRTLDATGYVGVGSASDSSIAIGRDGYPVMSYYDSTLDDLKFLKCADVTCSSTIIRTIESAGYVGKYNAIAIGRDGYPVIAYYNDSSEDLKFAKCDDASCSTTIIRTIDTSAQVGVTLDVTIGQDGYPIMSYNDWTNDDLKFAKCDDASCSSATVRVIDNSPGQMGIDSSLAVGRDGFPIISYKGGISLKFAKCADASCSVSTLRISMNGNGVTTLAIGRDGFPVVALPITTSLDLGFVRCLDASCSASTTMIIDSVGDVGRDTSLAIGRDGYPVISYYDLTNGDLKFAYVGAQTKLNTTPPPSPKTASGLVGWWTFDGKDVNWATGRVTDRSGQGNTGQMVGMSTTTAPRPGKIGQGMRFFTYPTDDYIDAGSAPVLDDIPLITLSAWINPRTTGEGAQGKIIRKGDSDASASWTFGFYGGGVGFTHAFSSGDGFWNTQYGVSMKTWSHVAVTYDRSSSANLPIIYINGVATTTTGTASGTADDDYFKNVYIGGRYGGARDFDGTIDDVRIYNRILTAQEIRDIYNQTRGSTVGQCGPGPVLDADGNKYSILQIGTQCWLDRNMNVGTRISGGIAQLNNYVIEKYCYDDTDSNCTDNHPRRPDGGLYEWYEAIQHLDASSAEGAQGICPSGWHVPSDREWYILESFLKQNGQTCGAGRNGTECSNAGEKLKPSGLAHFEANFSGFMYTGVSSFRDTNGRYWSSTPTGTNSYVRIFDSSAGVNRATYSRSRAFSVRCIKN